MLSLSEGNYGPPAVPQPGVTPGARERQAVAPAVEALVQAGIAEDAIEIIVGPSVREGGSYVGPAIAILKLEVAAPTATRITELVDAATLGAADERLVIGRVGVRYGVADCATLEREARTNAIADARESAGVQAELLGVSLGDVTASRDYPAALDLSYGPAVITLAGRSCAPIDMTGTVYGAFTLPSFDPTAEPEVMIYAQIELTFDISGTAEATPAA